MDDNVRAALRAGYRLGLCDAMLHKDVIEALKPPGIAIRSAEGEREYRASEIESLGLSLADLKDMRL